MCNVEDDGEKQPTKLEKLKTSLQGTKCVKCGQPGVLITRIHDSFCKACFQVYVVHKFRSAIGKSKLIRDGDQVLVAFSGGANSAALLHLIQDGLSERAHKKLRFTPTILHVDECCVLGISETDWQETRQKVIQLMLKSGFPSYLTNLEQVLNIERRKDNSSESAAAAQRDDSLAQLIEDSSSISLPGSSECDKLMSLISSMASLTSKEDVLRNLRNQLVVAVACQLGFNKVLTAECSTRLSIRILTDVAQGRGSQVSLNTGFSDERNDNVMFIRPVRDLNAKELVMYNSLFDVDSIFIPSITTKTTSGSSIERLTETFVTGLQADFPSTVSNIVRTSEKLGLPDLLHSTKCSFCQSPLDTDVGKASALHAVEFSQKLSRSAQGKGQTITGSDAEKAGSQSSGPCHGDDAGCCDEGAHYERFNQEDLNQSLCYGCRLSLHNFGDELSALPSFITKEVIGKKEREALRGQISEFLLDDNDEDR